MLSNEIEKSRKRLLDGVRRFRREVYPEREAAYWQVISEGQNPHALFITCADSRIDPELITQSGPGEILVSRNIGNLVLSYGEMMGGVSTIIDYAVAGRLAQGSLGPSGWVYDIGNGAVRVYNDEQRKFLTVTPQEQASARGSSE
jgi:carbonic anhydrase